MRVPYATACIVVAPSLILLAVLGLCVLGFLALNLAADLLTLVFALILKLGLELLQARVLYFGF